MPPVPTSPPAAPTIDGSAREVDLTLRAACHGLPPVTARLEPWQREACADADQLAVLLEAHGSPINLHHPGPFARNVRSLQQVARDRGVALEVLFARKADKALVYVDAADALGIGVDTASDAELEQCLARGVPAARLVSTAAVKPASLVRRCLDAEVPVVIDNHDELDRVQRLAAELDRERPLPVVLRVSGITADGAVLPSRFGLDLLEVAALGSRLTGETTAQERGRLQLTGLHFHLDGYAAGHRIAAIDQTLPLIDVLRAQGHPITSLDIGGGLPMSYVDDAEEWATFERDLRRAVVGSRAPVTYANHGLGLHAVDGRVVGSLATYPYHQSPTAVPWLAQVLDAPLAVSGGTVAGALRRRGLVLRCEPGRSILDGCGLTVARVEHRKRLSDAIAGADRAWAIGLGMNRTQCATAKADHAVDPLLLPVGDDAERTGPIEGFLTGAYCTEGELVTWRRLAFPHGVARGDLVVFVNTAGYLMHFIESRSHQFPLARNLVVDRGLATATLDPIDHAS